MTLEPPKLQSHALSGTALPRPEDQHYQAAYALLVERWGVTRTRRNHGAVHLLRALCSRPSFRAGKRVAWSTSKVASALQLEPRTVTTIIAKLREFPELIIIRTVRPGELRWNGKPARFKHLDWQQGPALRQRMAQLADSTEPRHADLTSVLHRCDVASPTDVTSLDLVSVPLSDTELKRTSGTSSDQLNFTNPNTGRLHSPEPPAAENPPTKPSSTPNDIPKVASSLPLGSAKSTTDGHNRPRRSDLRPPRKTGWAQQSAELDVQRLAHPVQLLAVIIRSVLGRGDRVRLHPDEFYLVDGALRCLSGQYAIEAIPGLIDQVLGIALRDHARARAEGRTTRERPTLAYIFGGPEDAPHLPHRYFLDRVTELREQRSEAEKHQHSADHARLAKLLFAPGDRSGVITDALPTPHQPPLSLVVPGPPRPLRDTSFQRLTAAEIDEALAQVEASWQEPHRACAG